MTAIPMHPTVRVARTLSALLDMVTRLEEQAINDASDSLMPGGKAMVALAHVANLEAWEHRYETAERHGLPADHVADEDDAWEPPLQTLCFWSEQWRRELDMEYISRPTIASEAAFLRNGDVLNWAWDNEPHFDEFAKDASKALRRLEDVLTEGERSERGAPCLYDECRGVRLVRKLEPYRDDEGYKMWRHGNWHCPRCKRSWNEAGYASMVTAATEAAKQEDVDGSMWVSVDHAARVVGRSAKTIRTWLTRREVAEVCIIRGRRTRFVNLDEVRARHEVAERRGRTA